MIDPKSAQLAATDFARRLAALPEPAMRESAMMTYLDQTDPAQAVAVLERIHSRGRLGGGPPYDVALLALSGILNQGLPSYQLMAALYAAAKAAHFDELRQLFFTGPDTRPAEERSSDADRELTLGHRKVMARSGDRDMLDRLLCNPELEVIPHLLKNPRLTERDVVQLAARRPTHPDIQRMVVDSERWIVRHAVKRAVVFNPDTPTDVSTRLLGHLRRPDLREVHRTPTVPAPVREAAAGLAQRRKTDTHEPADTPNGQE